MSDLNKEIGELVDPEKQRPDWWGCDYCYSRRFLCEHRAEKRLYRGPDFEHCLDALAVVCMERGFYIQHVRRGATREFHFAICSLLTNHCYSTSAYNVDTQSAAHALAIAVRDALKGQQSQPIE